MPAPADIVHVAAGSGSIYGGRATPSTIWSGDIVLVGDSITDSGYPYRGSSVGIPLTLQPPRVVGNTAVAGHTIKECADIFQASLDNNPTANIVMIRIGTNGPGTGTYVTQLNRIFSMIEGAGRSAIFHAIPPKGIGTVGVDSVYIEQNAFIKAWCDAAPATRLFIDDSWGLGDANYNALPQFYADPEAGAVHPNSMGVKIQGEYMAPILKALFPDADPRITDGTDVYPDNSASDQWVQNPLNAGTDGTFYYASGVAPNDRSVSCIGFAYNSAISSIVAADVGDPVQAPWHRVELTAGTSNGSTSIGVAIKHPAIAAGDLKRFDVVAEIKLVDLDTAPLGYVSITMLGSGNWLVNERIPIGASGIRNDHFFMRGSITQNQALSHPANTLSMSINITSNVEYTASKGSFMVRCISVRGQTT